MSEKEDSDTFNPAEDCVDIRRRSFGIRWDDRRRRPGERRSREDRRTGEDRRKSERRLRVAGRRVRDEPFSFPDRRKGEDRRKNVDRRCGQRRGEDRRKIPDRRKQRAEHDPEPGDAPPLPPPDPGTLG
jgi:hypothetical protein